MTKQSAAASPDIDLHSEAELAAKGDDGALDRLFAALGGSAWGIGFSAADAVGPASDAVAKGFADLLQFFDNGLSVGDVRTELLRATRAVALEAANATDDNLEDTNAREPLTLLGETKDRQATLAFTALSEQMRSALWLTEAEGFTITKTAHLLGETHRTTEDLVRQARASFRGYYVDAVKREGLSENCAATLDKLAAYVGRSLPAGEVAAVEHHLAECKECRAIVMKLDDLEGRLHAAIPALPAWTRQQVADMWASYVPLVTVGSKGDTDKKSRSWAPWIGAAVVAAAALIVLISSGVFNSSSSTKSSSHQLSQVAAPAAPAPRNDAVTTPGPVSTTAPSTTIAPATTTTTVAPTTSTTSTTMQAPVAPAPTSPPTAVHRVTPTTSAPTTTARSGYSLVNLPPTPISH